MKWYFITSVFLALGLFSACENDLLTGKKQLVSLRCPTEWTQDGQQLWIYLSDLEGNIISETQEVGGDWFNIDRPTSFTETEPINLTIVKYETRSNRSEIVTYAEIAPGFSWYIPDYVNTAEQVTVKLREKVSCSGLRVASNKEEKVLEPVWTTFKIRYQGTLPTRLLVTTDNQSGNYYQWYNNVDEPNGFDVVCGDLVPMDSHSIDMNETLNALEIVINGHLHKTLCGHGYQFYNQSDLSTSNGRVSINKPHQIFQDYTTNITQWNKGEGRFLKSFGALPDEVNLPQISIIRRPVQLTNMLVELTSNPDAIITHWDYVKDKRTLIDWTVIRPGTIGSKTVKITQLPKIIQEKYPTVGFEDIRLYRLKMLTTEIDGVRADYLDYITKEFVNNCYPNGYRQYGVVQNY